MNEAPDSPGEDIDIEQERADILRGRVCHHANYAYELPRLTLNRLPPRDCRISWVSEHVDYEPSFEPCDKCGVGCRTVITDESMLTHTGPMTRHRRHMRCHQQIFEVVDGVWKAPRSFFTTSQAKKDGCFICRNGGGSPPLPLQFPDETQLRCPRCAVLYTSSKIRIHQGFDDNPRMILSRMRGE